jgi:hypothetical protein
LDLCPQNSVVVVFSAFVDRASIEIGYLYPRSTIVLLNFSERTAQALDYIKFRSKLNKVSATGSVYTNKPLRVIEFDLDEDSSIDIGGFETPVMFYENLNHEFAIDSMINLLQGDESLRVCIYDIRPEAIARFSIDHTFEPWEMVRNNCSRNGTGFMSVIKDYFDDHPVMNSLEFFTFLANDKGISKLDVLSAFNAGAFRIENERLIFSNKPFRLGEELDQAERALALFNARNQHLHRKIALYDDLKSYYDRLKEALKQYPSYQLILDKLNAFESEITDFNGQKISNKDLMLQLGLSTNRGRFNYLSSEVNFFRLWSSYKLFLG